MTEQTLDALACIYGSDVHKACPVRMTLTKKMPNMSKWLKPRDPAMESLSDAFSGFRELLGDFPEFSMLSRFCKSCPYLAVYLRRMTNAKK